MLENETDVTPVETDETGVLDVGTPEIEVEEVEGERAVEPEELDAVTPDEWEALKEKGYSPAQLEKSHTRFTQELEAVKAEAKELQPYRQLKEMMDEDPRIVAALERVLNEPLEGEDEVDVLRKKLSTMESSIATEKELTALHKYVSERGYDDFSDDEVIKHAIQNNLGSLRAAYHDMSFDKVTESVRERTLGEVKKGQAAKTVTTTAGAVKNTPTFTEKDIEAMTPAEFEQNRPAILAYYDSKRG